MPLAPSKKTVSKKVPKEEGLYEEWRNDPLKFQSMVWPHVRFYKKQREMIESVRDNKCTIVSAGNMLGKDFVAGFIVLWFFVTHYSLDRKKSSVRVITTSVKADHLRVLWAEIARFASSSEIPLLFDQGGPLILLNMEIRHQSERELRNPINYVIGQVSAKGEGMSGHHAENSLVVVDEASGVEQEVIDHAREWAGRELIFGNPNPCTNFFFQGVENGDLLEEGGGRYLRKVIRIKAEDSPNVKLALEEKKAGRKPSGKRILPGVLSWQDYVERRATWDKIMQCIKLDAMFYKGAEILMFPPEWLNLSEQFAATLPTERKGTTIGIDTAEGGDNTVWAVCDHQGLIKLVKLSTPDTSVIGGRTIALMKEYGVQPENVIFDQGGGGQEHADYLRLKGYNVRVVSFGESVAPEPVNFVVPFEEKVHDRREKYTFKNRRAQMYWILRQRLNPVVEGSEDLRSSFGIPEEHSELRRQLAPIPLLYDEEGRIFMLPKRKKPTAAKRNTTQQTLLELIGCSPDEADALAMAVYALEPGNQQVVLKPMF